MKNKNILIEQYNKLNDAQKEDLKFRLDIHDAEQYCNLMTHYINDTIITELKLEWFDIDKLLQYSNN